MAEKINLRSSKVKAQKRRVGEYGTETPLSSAGVERGTTRWLNGSTVVIEGLLDVTGTTTISGVLNVSGQTTLSGATTIAGPTGITGALTIQGATTVEGKFDVTGAMATKGTLSVEGITTLKNHLNVDAGKKITLGGLVLENQGAASAAVQMPGGGLSASTALGMLLQHNSVIIGGQTSLKLESPAISLVGSVTVDGRLTAKGAIMDAKTIYAEKIKLSAASTTTQPANVYMTADGYLQRVI